MKKIIVALVVLILALVVAPWAIGRHTEARVNAGLDKIIDQAPYLSIVERKWTSGWFRSEQTVTFEILAPWVRAMNPATVLEEIEKAEQAAAQDAAQAATGTDENAPEAQPPAPAAMPPMRFTVRNEILHGPVLWPASLGLARVNSKLILSDEIRKELIKIFGTDEPVRISTRVGFFGGGSTRLSGDGKTIKADDGTGSVSYDDFKLDMGYSKNLDSFDVNGKLPRIEATNADKSERFLLTEMTLVGESKRIRGEIYDGDYKFAIDKLQFAGADKVETSIEHIHYLVKSSVADDFVDVAAKLGSGKVTSPPLAQIGLSLDEVHYDFALRRLHVDTLNKMMEAIKASYSQPVVTKADVDAALMAPLKTHGLELLKYDPEFVIDRIGIVTPEGEGFIKGVIRLRGITEADFAPESMSWIPKIDADFTVDVAQKLLEKIPNGATSAGLAVDQGYAKHEGEKLVSHIEFKKGALKINGKPLELPGFGAPPPDAAERDEVAPE